MSNYGCYGTEMFLNTRIILYCDDCGEKLKYRMSETAKLLELKVESCKNCEVNDNE